MSTIFLISLGTAQEHFATARGKITWHAGTGNPNVRNARVQVIDDSGKHGRVLRAARSDNSGRYSIENLAEGSYEIVACDDHFDYVPKMLVLPIKSDGGDINLVLEVASELPGLEFQPGTGKALYLKHLETGCELGPFYSDDKGVFRISNISAEGFGLEYAYCLEAGKEPDDEPGPFTACLRKHLTQGSTLAEVTTRLLTQPEKIIRQAAKKQLHMYKFAKITFVDGKVSVVEIGLNLKERE